MKFKSIADNEILEIYQEFKKKHISKAPAARAVGFIADSNKTYELTRI